MKKYINNLVGVTGECPYLQRKELAKTPLKQTEALTIERVYSRYTKMIRMIMKGFTHKSYPQPLSDEESLGRTISIPRDRSSRIIYQTAATRVETLLANKLIEEIKSIIEKVGKHKELHIKVPSKRNKDTTMLESIESGMRTAVLLSFHFLFDIPVLLQETFPSKEFSTEEYSQIAKKLLPILNKIAVNHIELITVMHYEYLKHKQDISRKSRKSIINIDNKNKPDIEAKGIRLSVDLIEIEKMLKEHQHLRQTGDTILLSCPAIHAKGAIEKVFMAALDLVTQEFYSKIKQSA